MKNMRRCSLGFWLFLLGCLHSNAQKASLTHAPLAPALPADVLVCLPPAPANWKLTASVAQNNFLQWEFTVASRTYLEVLPPPQPGQPPKVPGTTSISIIDTAYGPAVDSLFLDPKAGTGPKQERTTLDDYPAIRTKAEKTGDDETILLWVKERFMVSVTVSHQMPDSDEKWARLVNFKALLQISDDGPTKLPTPLLLGNVDELVPTRNSTRTLYWHDPSIKPGP